MKKITAFALDPSTTRTGMDFNLQPQFGSSVVKNGTIGKNRFLSASVIDSAPAEAAGTGLPYSFRDRNKSKEI